MADEALDQFHQVDLETHRVRQASGGERIGLPARTGAAREVDQRLILQCGQWQPRLPGQRCDGASTATRSSSCSIWWQTPSSAAEGASPTSATSSARLHLRDQVLALSTRSWNSTCGCACWKAASIATTSMSVSEKSARSPAGHVLRH
jgi:hypothetical protein